jgi:hypothetical protein|tara:strand:+ start:120 stop:383 length:264 start_codon:yes stop_codon:yes gene_type:complete
MENKMVKLVIPSTEKVSLKRGNKIIQRPRVDYETNKSVWDFRGFKLVQDNVKENIKEVDQTFENESKVVPLKPKKRKTRKKKDESIN